MTRAPPLAAFSCTTREKFVSEKVLYYNKGTVNAGELLCRTRQVQPRLCQDIALLLSRKGEPLRQPRRPLPGRLLWEKGREGRPGPARRCALPRPALPCPPAVPPAGRCPSAVPVPVPAPAPPQRDPRFPRNLPPGRWEITGHSYCGGDPGAEHACEGERKGRRRRAVRHLPRPLGGRLGGGAAPGGGLGGAMGCGALPSPALPTLP